MSVQNTSNTSGVKPLNDITPTAEKGSESQASSPGPSNTTGHSTNDTAPVEKKRQNQQQQPQRSGMKQSTLPYGGEPFGNGANFVLTPAEYKKFREEDHKYYEIMQKILDRADVKIDGDRPFDVVLHHPYTCRRVLQKGSLGLGEAFMDGWWDTRDFHALDEFFRRVLDSGIEYYFPDNAKDTFNILKVRLFNPQTRTRSKKVGVQHYDIGNKFFHSMLGRTMQYSCGYWLKHGSDGTATPIDTLDEAQDTKLHMIGEKLRLKEGMEVLDVGCGWGMLAKYLATTYKVKVTGITISEEQRASAAERVKDNSNVTILNQDYRDVKFTKKFDRIVSVGMFEHVGPKNYTTFFKHMRRLLRDDDREAVMLLHTIGSKTTMESADQWYLKYIFPGGCLPSIGNIGKSIESLFLMEDMHNFGFFYYRTLLAWRENFLRYWAQESPAVPERQKEGSDVFFRMFYYYLSSSAGAFLARDLQLWQIVLSSSGVPGYPDIYRP